jgi:hypothetical protein
MGHSRCPLLPLAPSAQGYAGQVGVAADLGADGAVRLASLAHGPHTRERGLFRGVRNEAAVFHVIAESSPGTRRCAFVSHGSRLDFGENTCPEDVS